MSGTRLTATLTAVLLAAAATGQAEPAPAAPADPAAALAAAFAAALPPAAEARHTLIPWRDSLTGALAEARQRDAILYVYINDGDPASGRC